MRNQTEIENKLRQVRQPGRLRMPAGIPEADDPESWRDALEWVLSRSQTLSSFEENRKLRSKKEWQDVNG